MKVSSNSRSVSPGRDEPPETQVRSEEVSVSETAGWWSIAPYIVGTPSKIVTWSRAMTSSALPGSKRGMRVSVAP